MKKSHFVTTNLDKTVVRIWSGMLVCRLMIMYVSI